MKETVAAFERRTGLAYAPSHRLRVMGRPLERREACPTLFRFAGPEGMLAHLQGRLGRLGPARMSHVWMMSRPTGAYPRLVTMFGTIAVLEPMRLMPCRAVCFQHTRHNWVALNRTPLPERLVWMPPSMVRADVNLDRVQRREQAVRRFGGKRAYEEEARRVTERLAAYLEELSEARRAGVPGPDRHWCLLPARERRALLASHGVRPLWTRA